MAEKLKILILSCGTGGGHNSAALAIQEALLEKGIKADFIEYLDIISKRLKNGVNKLYISSTRKQGKVFKKVYKLGELYSKTRFKSPVYGLNYLNKRKLYKYIEENEYNYIITTHLFAAQALTAIKKEHPIHFIAVATDYVCIPFWEETNPDYFIIPSEELKESFTSKGIQPEKLLPFGIPVAKQYRMELSKEETKLKLGLEKGKRYILILSGSMGFGNILQMIKELVQEIQDIIFIVSCGNNKKLLDKLNTDFIEDNRVIALPFVNNISEYINASELVLTKPGGLTTTEIAVTRTPFIHTNPIPGCENYNAEYFEKKGMSIKCDTIIDVIESIKELLGNRELRDKMIKNQKENVSKDTCNKIIEIVLKNKG